MFAWRRSCLPLLGILLLSLRPAAAETLQKELAALLDNHPQIEAARKGVGSAGEALRGARADFMPTVSLTGEDGINRIDSPSRRDTQHKPWEKPHDKAAASIKQNLFAGYKTTAATDAADIGRRTAQTSLEAVRQAVMFEGIAAYVDTLRQNRLVQLAMVNERTVQRQLNLESERVQRGAGITVDELQAKSQLQFAKEKRVTFEGALLNAQARYTQVFDHPPQPAALTDPSPPAAELPATIEEAVAIAQAENPQITASAHAIDAAAAKRKAAQAGYYPTIDLVGKTAYEKDSEAVLGVRRDRSVVVSATWDLFSGFATDAAAAQAAFEYGASKDSSANITRKVAEQTRLSWQALQTAKQRLALLDNAVNIASEVFESRKKLREAGKETVINVLLAQTQTYDAQITHTSAAYDARLATYQLLLAMGRLTPDALGIAPVETPAPLPEGLVPAAAWKAEPEAAPIAAPQAPPAPAANPPALPTEPAPLAAPRVKVTPAPAPLGLGKE